MPKRGLSRSCRWTFRTEYAKGRSCLPAVAGYVSAGQVGAEIAVSGAESNPLVLGLGIAATLGAITLSGNIERIVPA